VPKGLVGFLQVFIDRTSLVVGRVISIAEGTLDITRALARRVATSAFHASWFEVEKILGVRIPLTVGTLCNVSGVLGWFESDFALL
jgi:predicted benzoate:H+ symporter BenE